MAQHAQYNPASPDTTIRTLTEGQPDHISITTPATPGDELAIPHGLARIPKGCAIVDQPYQHLVWGRGQTAWTRRHLYLRFSLASTDLSISVF